MTSMPHHGQIGRYASWVEDGALVGRGGHMEAVWCKYCGGWVKAVGMREWFRHLHGRCQRPAPRSPGVLSSMPNDWPNMVDPLRARVAAELYNRLHDGLVKAGWKEKEDETICPGWSWVHPDRPGTWSMDAAVTALCQSKPQR